MTLFTEYVEEANRTSLELGVLNAEFRQSLLDEPTHLTRLGDAGEVAFHVGHETGDACLTERFCHHLQGDGLTCTCGTRYQSVAVGHLTCDTKRTIGAVGDIKPSFLVVHKIYSLNFLQR